VHSVQRQRRPTRGSPDLWLLTLTDIASAEEFGAYKTSPQVYREAAARFELDPSQCAMVATHLFDLKAAKAQGFQNNLC
jgi:2-haloacid dehalogenase